MPSNVDLLPNNLDSSEKKTNSFFIWVSNGGKYILLFANTILFILFMYRFYVDRQVVLLTRQVSTLHQQITSKQTLALEYNDIQKITKLVEDNKVESLDTLFLLNMLKQVTPSGVEIKSVFAKDSKLTLQAESLTPESFSVFMGYFLQEDRFKSVSLDSSILDKETGAYNFVLSIGL